MRCNVFVLMAGERVKIGNLLTVQSLKSLISLLVQRFTKGLCQTEQETEAPANVRIV